MSTQEETIAPKAKKDKGAEPTQRSLDLRAKRRAIMAETFQGKKFSIEAQVELAGDSRYVTPLKNKGRSGYKLVEVGNPANVVWAGADLLKIANADFNSIVNMRPKAVRRTPEQRAADEALKAAEREAKRQARDTDRAAKLAAKADAQVVEAEAKHAAQAPEVADSLPDSLPGDVLG